MSNLSEELKRIRENLLAVQGLEEEDQEVLETALKDLRALAAKPAQHVQEQHCIWARSGNTPCPHTNLQEVAYLFTNVQSGDIESSVDPDYKQDEEEFWCKEPLGKLCVLKN